MFTNYSYERVRVTEINDGLHRPAGARAQPVPARLAAHRRRAASGSSARSRRASSTTRSTSRSSRPRASASRASIDLAGLGGNTNFYKPTLEGVWYLAAEQRGCRSACARQVEYIHAVRQHRRSCRSSRSCSSAASTASAGSTSGRIGPQDPVTGLVLGGNKSLLFNVEQNITIAGPVRLILFYDAGQVRDVGQPFAWKETITRRVVPASADPVGPRSSTRRVLECPRTFRPSAASVSAFKTSTGAEIRFFMPVLNVPFRLIFAYNPQRGGRAATTSCSRRRRSSSGSRSARRSDRGPKDTHALFHVSSGSARGVVAHRQRAAAAATIPSRRPPVTAGVVTEYLCRHARL